MWTEFIGTSISPDYGQDIDADSNAVYISGRYSPSDDAYVAKYDLDGNQIWFQSWSAGGIEAAPGLSVTSDSVYITGITTGNESNGDIFIVKYDKNGNKIWDRVWGGSGGDVGVEIAEISGNVYVVGYTDSYGAGGYDVVILKYDANGNFQWSKTWGGSEIDYAYDMDADSNGIIVSGQTFSFGWDDAYMAKFDLDGNHQWTKVWGGTGGEDGYSLSIIPGGIVWVGRTESYGAGNDDAFIIKTDGSGNVIWYKTWGGIERDQARAVSVYDEIIHVTGYTRSFGAGDADAFLVAYDLNGNQQWNQTWGGSGTEEGDSIIVNSNGIFIEGFTETFGPGLDDAFLSRWTIDYLPVISTPPDINYIYGSIGNSISWTVTDADTGATSFTIYRNSTTVSSGSWTPGRRLSRSIATVRQLAAVHGVLGCR
ncbi:MAG: hypothetical protein ACTSRA_10690 [Promethearchaeota archaeon]